MRGTSLNLMCLHWGRSNSYVEISNLAALFGRKKSINHDTLVPSYFVIFLCPEVHHLTFWLFPRHLTAHWWHLSSLRSRWTWIAACIGPWNCCFTRTALTGVHPSAPASYQGRCLGPLWPSRLRVSLILFPFSGPSPSSFFTNEILQWSSPPAAFSIS